MLIFLLVPYSVSRRFASLVPMWILFLHIETCKKGINRDTWQRLSGAPFG